MEMINFFEKDINLLGKRIEEAIGKASDEISKQRGLTKVDLEELIVFASVQFGDALDQRIEKAKHETGELISAKLTEFKTQLSDAAEKQKKATIRNATVGVCGAILVSVISLLTKKSGADGFNAIDVYRTVMAAIAGGYLAAIIFKFARTYLETPEIKKNSIIAGASYIDALKPKALGPHLVIFATALLGWAILNETDFIITLLSSIKR